MGENDQRNVTLGKKDKRKYFPCPLCDNNKLVKYSKKLKPYIVCNSCGVQLFVRNKEGEEILNKRIFREK